MEIKKKKKKLCMAKNSMKVSEIAEGGNKL